MSAEDMVDAALAGLDQGEIVTIPSLPEQVRVGRIRGRPPGDVRQAFERRAGEPVQCQPFPTSRGMI